MCVNERYEGIFEEKLNIVHIKVIDLTAYTFRVYTGYGKTRNLYQMTAKAVKYLTHNQGKKKRSLKNIFRVSLTHNEDPCNPESTYMTYDWLACR